MKSLDVYLHNDPTGHLTQDGHGQIFFKYAEPWLSNIHAVPLSASLPLREQAYPYKECNGFFEGVLPEQYNRGLIAKILGISPHNDFFFFVKIGGECAGAVTFIPTGEKLRSHSHQYRLLTDGELVKIIEELPQRPLLAGMEEVRLSLAGAQDKIAVKIENNNIYLPLGNSPSTHILKPDHPRYKGLIYNEDFCMKLAKGIGLPTAKTETKDAQGHSYLLIERYDRINNNGVLERIHQEDFCQALNIPSMYKYQNEGGPSIKQCFALIKEISSAPAVDFQQLLKTVIYNFVIGNNDAHGKNFSFLRHKNRITLTPAYDIVSTSYYPGLSKKMAMKIGGEYDSARVRMHHFEKMAGEIGMGKSFVHKFISGTVNDVLKKINGVEKRSPAAEEVSKHIEENAKRIMSAYKLDK